MQTVQILGVRGSRTIGYILPMVETCRQKGQRVLLLVPEQYTLQAERELVQGLNLPGLLDIDVLSPRRLTRRIHESGGRLPLAPLDDRGRLMALAQALTQVQEELVYYRRVALTTGLPEKLSVLMADLQRAGVTAQELAAQAEKAPSGALKAKAADVACVWAAYEALIDGRFADDAMQQQDVRQRVAASGVMDGAAVFVCGFDVIPQPMGELLAEAAKTAASLTVIMTMDAASAADGRVFLTQRRSAAELMETLQRAGIPVQLRYLPAEGEGADGRDPALVHLEKYLFTRQAVKFTGDSSAVMAHMSANPYAEAGLIARTLRQWHDAGMPWQHMAVAMAEGNTMPGILAVTLAGAGIPHYIARKDGAARHGLCRLLLGALRCVSGGYLALDVMHMAKSGFAPVTPDEAHRLENYAIAHGISRGKWTKPFTRGADAEELARMEEIRQRLITPAETLRERLRGAKSAAASVEAIFRFLEDAGAYDRLIARENELLLRGMGAEAASNRQVWQLILDLLDQLHALLGERRAAMKDVARFVESALTGAAVSSLPPQPDAVMIGEAGHLLTGRIDGLILCGMQDGVMGSVMQSLVTEAERRALSDAAHRAIGLSQQETAALRQSDFYRTLALPCRKLLITCSLSGQDGTAMRPSGLLDDLQGLFPALTVTGGVTADGSGEELPLSPADALDALALRLREVADGVREGLEPAWLDALRWLWRSPEWHTRLRCVLDALEPNETGRISPEMTRRIFTQDKVSISRLERFAACPYQHFVDYGLKPVKREEFVFDANDAGDFYHAALQGFAHAAMERPDWPDLPEEEVEAIMEQVLAPLTEMWADGPLNDTPAQRLQGSKYIRTAKRAAWLFTRHAQRSRFVTVGEEVAFGEEGGLPPVVLTLQDGRRIALRGKIDRIDRWEGDDGVYLRVIDYKSSQRDIDPTRLWYGLQLQLMLYLQAASQGMNGNAAGAFYFTVKDPLVEAEDAKDAVERELAKALRLRGVVLADTKVVDAMDEGGYALGEMFNKDGGVKKNAPAYTAEEMQQLLEHTKETAAVLADGIRAGDVAVSPAEVDSWSACQWCDYAAVCGMDPSRPGCTKRVLPHMKRQELLQRLANDTDTGTQ